MRKNRQLVDNQLRFSNMAAEIRRAVIDLTPDKDGKISVHRRVIERAIRDADPRSIDPRTVQKWINILTSPPKSIAREAVICPASGQYFEVLAPQQMQIHLTEPLIVK